MDRWKRTSYVILKLPWKDRLKTTETIQVENMYKSNKMNCEFPKTKTDAISVLENYLLTTYITQDEVICMIFGLHPTGSRLIAFLYHFPTRRPDNLGTVKTLRCGI